MWRRMWTLRSRFHSIEEERRIELVEMLTVIVFFAHILANILKEEKTATEKLEIMES